MLESILVNNTFYFSIFCGLIVALCVSSRVHIKCFLKRFIRIQLRKYILDSKVRPSDNDSFSVFYRNVLCHSQKTNNDLLATILKQNHKCAFYIDRCISFLSSHRPPSATLGELGYSSVDEFREKVQLTTFDEYRPYIDRIIQNGEKNVVSASNIVYFSTSSGTTGKIKLMPVVESIVENFSKLPSIAYGVIWRCLSSSLFMKPEEKSFFLQGGKRAKLFPKSKDGIPIGPLTQISSGAASFRKARKLASLIGTLSLDFIEEIPDFDTSTLIQLIFALIVPNIAFYAVIFAPGFIHTVKLIEKYYEEIVLCISFADFNHSTLVQNHIKDKNFIQRLNRALEESAIEYGGQSYRVKRADYIRQQCQQQHCPGLLHRLWPSLRFTSTSTGGSFSIYKQDLQFYSGDKIPVVNQALYAASEGILGIMASIHTDEYFLIPTAAFFEFIPEEDAHLAQPKTLLISEIEPGKRYELVCTTEAGFVRYRMGDVLTCTRFVSRTNDLVPLPSEPVEIPRIPIVSIAYRLGSLLDVFGEKTSEQHIINACLQTIAHWKKQGINVNMGDFTSYPNLDAFPSRYVIFLELVDDENTVDYKKLQSIVSDDFERELCDVNHKYKEFRSANRVGPVDCVLVQSATFSEFLRKELTTMQVSAIQVKPHRLLKNQKHIQFFYDHRIQ